MHDLIPVAATYSAVMGVWVLVLMPNPGAEGERASFWLTLPIRPFMAVFDFACRQRRR